MTIPTWDSLQLLSEPTIFGHDFAVNHYPYPYQPHQATVPGIYFHGSSGFYEMQGWGRDQHTSTEHLYAFHHPQHHSYVHHSYPHHCYRADLSSNRNSYGFEYISAATVVSRKSIRKRRATGGTKKAWRKKHKYELGRRPSITKLSNNKTSRRIRVGVSKSLEVEHDNGTSMGFESKMLEFAQSLKRVEELLQQMISSAKKRNNDVALEKEKISENGAVQMFDKIPEKEETEVSNELQVFDEIPEMEETEQSNNDEVRALDWDKVYALICSEYEALSIQIDDEVQHDNAENEPLQDEDEREGNLEMEDQVFDNCSQTKTIELCNAIRPIPICDEKKSELTEDEVFHKIPQNDKTENDSVGNMPLEIADATAANEFPEYFKIMEGQMFDECPQLVESRIRGALQSVRAKEEDDGVKDGLVLSKTLDSASALWENANSILGDYRLPLVDNKVKIPCRPSIYSIVRMNDDSCTMEGLMEIIWKLSIYNNLNLRKLPEEVVKISVAATVVWYGDKRWCECLCYFDHELHMEQTNHLSVFPCYNELVETIVTRTTRATSFEMHGSTYNELNLFEEGLGIVFNFVAEEVYPDMLCTNIHKVDSIVEKYDVTSYECRLNKSVMRDQDFSWAVIFKKHARMVVLLDREVNTRSLAKKTQNGEHQLGFGKDGDNISANIFGDYIVPQFTPLWFHKYMKGNSGLFFHPWRQSCVSRSDTPINEWPSSLETKGRVPLDVFVKFLQELHMSRSPAVIFVQYIRRDKSSENVQSYVSDERLGFVEPTSAVELYLCLPHRSVLDMLTFSLGLSSLAVGVIISSVAFVPHILAQVESIWKFYAVFIGAINELLIHVHSLRNHTGSSLYRLLMPIYLVGNAIEREGNITEKLMVWGNVCVHFLRKITLPRLRSKSIALGLSLKSSTKEETCGNNLNAITILISCLVIFASVYWTWDVAPHFSSCYVTTRVLVSFLKLLTCEAGNYIPIQVCHVSSRSATMIDLWSLLLQKSTFISLVGFDLMRVGSSKIDYFPSIKTEKYIKKKMKVEDYSPDGLDCELEFWEFSGNSTFWTSDSGENRAASLVGKLHELKYAVAMFNSNTNFSHGVASATTIHALNKNDGVKRSTVIFDPGEKVLTDAYQNVPHLVINIKNLDINVIGAFSNMMCGPACIGFFYDKDEIISTMPFFFNGSEMKADVIGQPHLSMFFDIRSMDYVFGLWPVSHCKHVYCHKVALASLNFHSSFFIQP